MTRLAIYGVILFVMTLLINDKDDQFQYVCVMALMMILGEVIFMRDELRKGGDK